MRLSVLSVRMMINTTEDWIGDHEIRDQLLALGPLGVGLLAELVAATTNLVELSGRHKQLREALRILIKLCQQLHHVHDRKARGLYYALTALIELSDDPEQAAVLVDLQDRLFPAGLRVVHALDHEIPPKLRAQLAAVSFANQSLEQVFDAWVEAGHKLARATKQRARIEASMDDKHSAVGGPVDLRAGRERWMQAVRGLLWAIETKAELAALVEPVESTLRGAIAIADRRRLAGRLGASAPMSEPGAPELLAPDDSGELALNDDAHEQLFAELEAEIARSNAA